jgi:hypothetical protein
MKPLHILFASLLPLAAQAADPPPALAPVAAIEISFEAQLYVARPVVVFADSPADPNFQRQMDLLARDPAALAERDVVVVTDTDPAARSEWRLKLRPRGFGIVILDKDLKPVIRKPLPWDVREISRVIDKLPMRQQEVRERREQRD